MRREVRQARHKEGRGSVLGPDTNRRTSWWELTLECGHVVERPLRRDHPAPKRVRCHLCEDGAA